LNILVIAAHPDDEVIGMGGTIKKLTKNKHTVNLCVVSEGSTAQYDDPRMIQVRKNACMKCGKLLGISNFVFLEFPDMRLDSVPHIEINNKLEKIIKKYKPEVVYTTPPNDLNKDHLRVFESTLVATRPKANRVEHVMCYELPGPIKKPFEPTVYEDIESEFATKLKAFRYYKSEIEKFPHPRSLKALESLATYRGVQSGLKKAESFQLIKSIH
jgi:LmbE family N-acetylglucosaminyl deacetylase